MQSHAVAIAETYLTDSTAWIEAAASIRQPYWDWAKNSLPPDEVITLDKVTIIRADGPAVVDNPLFAYGFHPGPDPSFYEPYVKWPTTIRHPIYKNPNQPDPSAVQTNVQSLVT